MRLGAPQYELAVVSCWGWTVADCLSRVLSLVGFSVVVGFPLRRFGDGYSYAPKRSLCSFWLNPPSGTVCGGKVFQFQDTARRGVRSSRVNNNNNNLVGAHARNPGTLFRKVSKN